MDDIYELKSNAIVSATYDTVLQACLRVISFILNAFVVRHVTTSVFAVMTVRLHLLYATGLLLSREAFRRASLGCKSHRKMKKVVNLIWIGAALSIPLCGIGWLVWCYVMETPPSDVTIHYSTSVSLILCGIIVEVCTESPYIIAELQLWAKVKVLIEGGMQLSRAVLLAIGIYIFPEKAVLIYGLSHFAGSLLYSITYYILFAVKLRRKEAAEKMLVPNFSSLFVTFTKGQYLPEIDDDMWRVSVSFLKQGVLKEALTEGEFYLMNLFPLVTLSDQGVYQVVSNLGSLAARLVFRSIEAVAYKFFARSLHRGMPIRDQDKSKMKEVSGFVHTLLKSMILISLLIVTFGWAYAHPLLQLYGGSKLSLAGRGLLRAQCLYIVFLALNGIVEAFTFATMSDEQLARHNYVLVLFSVVYVSVTVVSTYFLGVYGFIIGNCVNMFLRIVHSLRFMKQLFEGSGTDPLKALVIQRQVFVTLFFAFMFTALSEVYVYPTSFLAHLAIGLGGGLTVIVILREDMKDIIVAIFSFFDKIYSKVFMNEKGKHKFNFSLFNLIDHWFYQ